eukprot:1016626-Pleurochrysis_carterae.AAC.1
MHSCQACGRCCMCTGSQLRMRLPISRASMALRRRVRSSTYHARRVEEYQKYERSLTHPH